MVIFDLDGVLVDACEWHRAALNEALREVCNYEISSEDHYNKFNGLPTKVKLDALTEMHVLSKDKHLNVYNLKQEKTKKIIESTAKIRQEKIDLLEWLLSKGITVACFTNSIGETAHLMLEKTGILRHFHMVLTNQDVKNAKPDPEGYVRLLKEFQISNKNAIIVEDSPKGLEAANAAGCRVISVKNASEVTIDLFKRILE